VSAAGVQVAQDGVVGCVGELMYHRVVAMGCRFVIQAPIWQIRFVVLRLLLLSIVLLSLASCALMPSPSHGPSRQVLVRFVVTVIIQQIRVEFSFLWFSIRFDGRDLTNL
jgi:hypothetical protein